MVNKLVSHWKAIVGGFLGVGLAWWSWPNICVIVGGYWLWFNYLPAHSLGWAIPVLMVCHGLIGKYAYRGRLLLNILSLLGILGVALWLI